MQIRKAERKKAKLRLGISGLSGGGKTWSALEIAHGMGKKIGMIDTESGRGELYAGCKSKHDPDIIFEYDVIRLDAPYSPDRYIEAIKAFEKAGYDVLIIDSLSHAWSGDGGVLSIVDKATEKFQMSGWKIGTPKQNALVDALIQSKMHLITCMRSKTEWTIELNGQGKNVPRKIGLAPIQRDQIEYEFTVFMSMSQDNIAHVTKDSSDIYFQSFTQPTPEMGRQWLNWLNTGIDESEQFASTLCDIINDINSISSLEELKSKYVEYGRLYSKRFPDEFEKITVAKDAKKEQLMSSALDKMNINNIDTLKGAA